MGYLGDNIQVTIEDLNEEHMDQTLGEQLEWKLTQYMITHMWFHEWECIAWHLEEAERGVSW
jgi:hypothetical protein